MKITLHNILTAETLWQKTWGVMFWSNFHGHTGVLLTDTNAIHSFFVRFGLDVVFLDENYKVVRLVQNLKPFRMSPIVLTAKHTLEMPAGSIGKYGLKIGTQIDLV